MEHYGCWTEVEKDKTETTPIVQDGWMMFSGSAHKSEAGQVRRMIRIESTWQPIGCGHLERDSDPYCNGCYYQPEDKGLNKL